MEYLDPIAKHEWVDWKQNKVTKALVADLFQKREVFKEGFAEGRFQEKESNVTVGYCQALKDTIDYIISDFDFQENPDDKEDKE